jgi:hypothetical protein
MSEENCRRHSRANNLASLTLVAQQVQYCTVAASERIENAKEWSSCGKSQMTH